MNKFLSENSVAKLLLKKGKLDVKLNVCSETFNSPMTLVGFIPYNELDSLEFYNPRIDMNGAIFFTPYRISVPGIEKTFPVMKKIRFAKESEIFLIQRKLITPYGIKGFWEYFHYIETEELTETKIKNVLSSKIRNILKQVKSSPNYVPDKLIKNADGFLEYKTSASDFVSTRTYGDYKVISNNFLCLCAYTNIVTGKPCYSLFDPEDIYIMAETDNDE